ncbi:MAG: hypothetical protein ACTSPY_05565 [Candidatus Helarchaeota archaeon]
MKFFSKYEYNKKKFLGFQERKIRFKLVNKFFNTIERFPFPEKFNSTKKLTLLIFGWIVYIYCFIIGTYIRTSIEFLNIVINLPYIIAIFGFYGFVLASGAMCTFFFTKTRISNVYKLILIAIPMILQIPIIVDYTMLGIASYMKYSYIDWSDFLISFMSFFLHPKIQSYAVHLGHPIMFFTLMTLSTFYIFYRNLYSPNTHRDTYIIVIYSILYNITMYIIFQISGIFVPLIYTILDNFYQTRLPIDPIIISNSFYLFVFISIWLKIHIDEKQLLHSNLKLFKKYSLLLIFPLKNYNITYIFEKTVFKLRYKIKMVILTIIILIYEWIIFILTF